MFQPFPSLLDVSRSFAGRMRDECLHHVSPVSCGDGIGAAHQRAASTGAGARSSETSDSYKVKTLQLVSGPTPFAQGCPGADLDDAHIAGYESESTITVNPANPRNIVASWIQDASAVGGRSDLVASSGNLGKSWTRSTIPGLTACTGGTADAAADPWLSAGVDGTVYFTGVAASFSPEGRIAEIVASHATDGGHTWSSTVTVGPPDLRNDKPAITADPSVPGRAYTIWANWDMQLNFPFTNLLEFARTEDHGATWSEPVIVDAAPSNAVDLSSAVLVLPDGALLGVFERIDIAPDFSATEEFFATRSFDGGETWLSPVEIGSMPIVPLADPETGEQLPQPGFLSAAASPDAPSTSCGNAKVLPLPARSTWDGRRTAEAPGPCPRCRA
jgi:hypothetical protein